jgi:hypothetical protein
MKTLNYSGKYTNFVRHDILMWKHNAVLSDIPFHMTVVLIILIILTSMVELPDVYEFSISVYYCII